MKDKLRKFYKMKMSCNENGLTVFTERYYLVHETEFFYFVIPEWQTIYLHEKSNEGETIYDLAKRKISKIKRFHKNSGRFAFDTKEEAFTHLKFLKRKQLGHLKRDIHVVGAFIEACKDKSFSDLPASRYGSEKDIPLTKQVVEENFTFD